MKLDGDVVREPIVEHVPPEITAARWFLLNRRPTSGTSGLKLGLNCQ